MESTTESIKQLPAKVNIHMIDDNDMSFFVKWNMDITNYQFEANIIPSTGGAEIPMIVSITNALEGEMKITITALSVDEITPSTNRWYLNWTVDGLLRTVASGALVLRPR